MKQIPLNAADNQTLSVVLDDQLVGLTVRQTRYGLFMGVYLDGALVIGGVICENLNRIVRSTYLGFSGDFVWQDTQGSADPDSSGIGPGGRFRLLYLTPDELAQVAA
jgi:hypothetical protein